MEVAEETVVPHQINAEKMKGTVIRILIALAISYVVKKVVLMTIAITPLDFQLPMTVAMTLMNVKTQLHFIRNSIGTIISIHQRFFFLE